MRTVVILSKGVVALLLGTVLLVLVALMGVTQLAQRMGYPIYVIDGGSMSPSIARGALAIDQPVDGAAIRVGDVISVHSVNGTIYTHRVAAVESTPDGPAFQTKGDANPSPDPGLVPAAAVVGRVLVWIPMAGFLLMFIGLPLGVPTLLTLIASLTVELWVLEDIEEDWKGDEQEVAQRGPNNGATPALSGRRTPLRRPMAAASTVVAGLPMIGAQHVAVLPHQVAIANLLTH